MKSQNAKQMCFIIFKTQQLPEPGRVRQLLDYRLSLSFGLCLHISSTQVLSLAVALGGPYVLSSPELLYLRLMPHTKKMGVRSHSDGCQRHDQRLTCSEKRLINVSLQLEDNPASCRNDKGARPNTKEGLRIGSLYTSWSIMEEDVVRSSTKLLCLVCSSYFEPQGFQSESTATSKSSKK